VNDYTGAVTDNNVFTYDPALKVVQPVKVGSQSYMLSKQSDLLKFNAVIALNPGGGVLEITEVGGDQKRPRLAYASGGYYNGQFSVLLNLSSGRRFKYVDPRINLETTMEVHTAQLNCKM
jgi:hypothetical protein